MDAVKIISAAAAGAAVVFLLTKRPKKIKKPSIKLTYFDLKAAPGDKVRLALALSGTEFEDHRVKFDDFKENIKPRAKYGQLPIMVITTTDGGATEIYQSGAMMRWAGTLGDGSLYPEDDRARMKIEEMLGLGDDLARAWTPGLYSGMRPETFGYTKETAPVQSLREKFIAEEFPKYMGFLTVELNETGAFLVGDKPTIADCQLFPQVHYFTRGVADHVPKDCMDKYPVVKEWLDRMLALPAVKPFYGA